MSSVHQRQWGLRGWWILGILPGIPAQATFVQDLGIFGSTRMCFHGLGLWVFELRLSYLRRILLFNLYAAASTWRIDFSCVLGRGTYYNTEKRSAIYMISSLSCSVYLLHIRLRNICLSFLNSGASNAQTHC